MTEVEPSFDPCWCNSGICHLEYYRIEIVNIEHFVLQNLQNIDTYINIRLLWLVSQHAVVCLSSDFTLYASHQNFRSMCHIRIPLRIETVAQIGLKKSFVPLPHQYLQLYNMINMFKFSNIFQYRIPYLRLGQNTCPPDQY